MDYKVLVQNGHGFELDKDDPECLKSYDSPNYHDGPHCLICKGYWCRNCSPEIFTEECPGRAVETLPGLEWAQPPPPPPKGTIIARRIRI